MATKYVVVTPVTGVIESVIEVNSDKACPGAAIPGGTIPVWVPWNDHPEIDGIEELTVISDWKFDPLTDVFVLK